MKYYAIENMYGSETSHGFSNTWQILVFKTKNSRDKYVENSTDITTSKIKKSELSGYTQYVKPFSGNYLGIEPAPEKEIDGFIGYVVVANQYDEPLDSLY